MKSHTSSCRVGTDVGTFSLGVIVGDEVGEGVGVALIVGEFGDVEGETVRGRYVGKFVFDVFGDVVKQYWVKNFQLL